MNYIKAQQEFVAYIQADTPRKVCFFHNKADQTTLLIDHTGAFCYSIPDCGLVLNLSKCAELHKLPFPACPTEDIYRITTDGSTVPGTNGKGHLLVFKTKQGAVRYVDKKLRDKFGKDAQFFQEKDLGVITVAEQQAKGFYSVIGYLCPCRTPKPTENQ